MIPFPQNMPLWTECTKTRSVFTSIRDMLQLLQRGAPLRWQLAYCNYQRKENAYNTKPSRSLPMRTSPRRFRPVQTDIFSQIISTVIISWPISFSYLSPQCLQRYNHRCCNNVHVSALTPLCCCSDCNYRRSHHWDRGRASAQHRDPVAFGAAGKWPHLYLRCSLKMSPILLRGRPVDHITRYGHSPVCLVCLHVLYRLPTRKKAQKKPKLTWTFIKVGVASVPISSLRGQRSRSPHAKNLKKVTNISRNHGLCGDLTYC